MRPLIYLFPISYTINLAGDNPNAISINDNSCLKPAYPFERLVLHDLALLHRFIGLDLSELAATGQHVGIMVVIASAVVGYRCILPERSDLPHFPNAYLKPSCHFR